MSAVVADAPCSLRVALQPRRGCGARARARARARDPRGCHARGSRSDPLTPLAPACGDRQNDEPPAAYAGAPTLRSLSERDPLAGAPRGDESACVRDLRVAGRVNRLATTRAQTNDGASRRPREHRANDGASRRPREHRANDGETRRTMARRGERWRDAANDGERRRTMANDGERRRTTARRGERWRDEANHGERWRDGANDGETRRGLARVGDVGRRWWRCDVARATVRRT
jgi:hypothetical protein